MKPQAKQTVLWCLVVVNVMLLTVLVIRHANSRAYAQARPSDYLAVPANVPGAANGVIYIVDTNNRQLSAMMYDPPTKRIELMPKVDLDPIFNQQVAPAPGGRR